MQQKMETDLLVHLQFAGEQTSSINGKLPSVNQEARICLSIEAIVRCKWSYHSG